MINQIQNKINLLWASTPRIKIWIILLGVITLLGAFLVLTWGVPFTDSQKSSSRPSTTKEIVKERSKRVFVVSYKDARYYGLQTLPVVFALSPNPGEIIKYDGSLPPGSRKFYLAYLNKKTQEESKKDLQLFSYLAYTYQLQSLSEYDSLRKHLQNNSLSYIKKDKYTAYFMSNINPPGVFILLRKNPFLIVGQISSPDEDFNLKKIVKRIRVFESG